MKKKIIKKFLLLSGFILLGICFQAVTSGMLLAKDGLGDKESPIDPGELEVEISGVVTDEEGNPLIGATVLLEGTAIGTVTDLEGQYTLSAPEDGVLIFSYVGFESQKTPIGSRSIINVQLTPDPTSLEEVVVVGYGEQKRINLTGAVTTVQGKEMNKVSNNDVTNNLTGRAPGVRVVQLSSEPGLYDTQIDIRGFSYTDPNDIQGNQQGGPLFVIDGVQRSQTEFSRLNPDAIESISVLKDASAAIYGLKAANGVVLVKTKEGQEGAMKFSYSGQAGIQRITQYPELSNAHQYATLWNEMQINDQISSRGEPSPPRYTPEEIEAFRTGEVPSTDWLGLILNNSAPQSQHNLSVSGGTDKIQYYASGGYFEEEGLFSSGISSAKKYNLNMNIKAELRENLHLGVNVGYINSTYKGPRNSIWNLLKNTWRQNPTESVYENGNPDYPSQLLSGLPHPLLQTQEASGYKKNDEKFLNSTFDLQYDMPFLEGLSAKALFAYDLDYNNNKRFTKKYSLYEYAPSNDTYQEFVHNSPSNFGDYFGQHKRKTSQVSLQYEGSFGNHNVSALTLFEQIDRVNNRFNANTQFEIDAVDHLFAGIRETDRAGSGYGESANSSYIGRFNYNYSSKYLLEFAFRYDGSSNFPENSRWGFFPSVSTGWRISEEAFMKDNLPFISNLKIRGSYGKLGDDQAADFQFLTGYTYPSGGYQFGSEWKSGLGFKNSANPNITWYTSTMSNIGLEADLWDRLFSVEVDFFRRDRDGLLAYRNTTLPEIYGVNLPQENLNEDRTQGYEIVLGHRNYLGNDFDYSVSANMTYARTQYRYREETPASHDYDHWRNRNAYRYNDVFWGYKTDGQFQSFEEIYAAPIIDGAGNRTILPGDIRYVDLNGDNIISGLDQTVIGRGGGKPSVYFGANVAFNWKNIDFSMLLQGATMYQVYYRDQLSRPFYWGEANPITIFNDRWHREDNLDLNSQWVPGEYPSTGARQNYHVSDYWLRDASYVRIKNIQVGYSIPAKWIEKLDLDAVRIFASGYNIHTWTKGLGFVDPEYTDNRLYSYNYPITMNTTLGVQVNF